MIPAPEDQRIVRYSPPFALSILFRLLDKRRPRGKLDVVYEPTKGTNGLRLRFRGPDALGIEEQTLLLALLEIAADCVAHDRRSCLLDATSTNLVGQALWSELHSVLPLAGTQTVFFQTTWADLAARCGLSHGGSVHRMVQQQLERLCATSVWAYDAAGGPALEQASLVAWHRGSKRGVSLALNHRLASAILGVPYATVSLAERNCLRTAPAKAIHAFLSAAVWQGHHTNIGVDTLAKRLWPDEAEGSTLRTRQSAVKSALYALGRLPAWEAKFLTPALAQVSRRVGCGQALR